MGDLAENTALERQEGEGRYRGVVSPDWLFLGPNGGYLATMALRAAGASSAFRRPATVACAFVRAPRLGPVDLEVTSLRRTRRAEALRVAMLQEGRLVLEAQVWTVGELAGFAQHAAPAPAAPPPEDVSSMEDLPPELRHPPAPIWSQIEEKLVGWKGPEVVSAPELLGWFRFRPRATFDDPFLDAGRALVLVDALIYPAAAIAQPPGTSFATTLDVTAHFHDFSGKPSPWLLCRTESPLAGDGLVWGRGTVWAEDGRCLASGQSQMLLLGEG